MNTGKRALVAGLAIWALHAQGAELITNGGFETGDLTGWSLAVQPISNGNLTVESGTTGPASGLSNVGPSAGSYFALSDQGGPGTYSVGPAKARQPA